MVHRDRRLWQRAQAGYLWDRYGRAVFMTGGSRLTSELLTASTSTGLFEGEGDDESSGVGGPVVVTMAVAVAVVVVVVGDGGGKPDEGAGG